MLQKWHITLYLLWTTVDLLEVGAEVGFGGFDGPGGQQVPLLQQVDWPQGLHFQLRHPTQPPECRRQLGQIREWLQTRYSDIFSLCS